SFKAKGTGYDYKTMRSNITASIKQLQYNKYNYRNADITANFDAGIIHSIGSINDSSLKLRYDIRTNGQSDYPTINGFVRVDTAQLQKLHLYKDTLNFSVRANIKANNLRPRHLDVNMLVDSVKVQQGKDFYQFDSLSLVATSANGRDSINFNSPFATLHAQGAFDYDKIAGAVTQYINHYYKIADSLRVKNIPDQQLTFDGVLKKHPFLPGIIPGLKGFDDINFKGSFTSADKDSALNLSVSLPYVAYQDKSIRNGNIIIGSRNEGLNYTITFDTLRTASNTFYGTRLNGSAANDSVLVSFITQDNKHRDWFGLKASLFTKDNVYSLRLRDSLLLNYERWNAASDNYIRYSPEGLIIHNFHITSDTASILINSRQELANSPIDINIDHFNLKSISSFYNRDTVFIAGILDAKMEVNDLHKALPAFTGNLSIDHLAVMQQPVGNLTLFAQKQSENNITANLALTGNDNDIEGKGNYYLNDALNQFDATILVKKLNVATLQGFSGGSIKNASGNLYGDMTMNGKFSDPRWKGSLHFDSTKFNISELGAGFKIDKQVIQLEYPDIKLDHFVINDSLGHPMTINGAVTIAHIDNFGLQLDIKARDFIVVNAPKAINSQIYGRAAVDADITVTGTAVAPDIEGNIAVKDNSDITIIIPQTSYSKNDGKTIVRFIDRDTFDINPPVIPFTPEKDTVASFAQFLNYNLNLEITKNAALTVIIDPSTGDEIKVQGDAQLNAGVDPGGHIVLSGNYELDKGHYLFNYQVLQRKFDLEKGSTIVFGGEPMKARIDITAVYTVNTSSRDLLENEVGTVDPILANSFNQRIPFKVILHLTGELSKPTIRFDIQMPDENTPINSELRTTIENKLAQIRGDEAATNKQVFSLLLLGRFVGEQSSDFFKGNGTDFSDLARQSVSQFLSSAMNEIAGNLLKGVDIDLNLNSYRDFSNGGNGQRTDLSVALTKTFLNDRLSITLGETFGVQGQNLSTNTNTSFVPDVAVGYKLTPDGKYLLRAYRKNQFEVVLDGYVVETGLAFVVTMDYDKFKELFTRKKKK
ncbi:MAG TPA: translocation/assembly module TamB domain-containing protein, partial [Ferruginibacter sp.]|nr:translocation/assembly module TamB domain-containing protein [Ferruginibacter sp.]